MFFKIILLCLFLFLEPIQSTSFRRPYNNQMDLQRAQREDHVRRTGSSRNPPRTRRLVVHDAIPRSSRSGVRATFDYNHRSTSRDDNIRYNFQRELQRAREHDRVQREIGTIANYITDPFPEYSYQIEDLESIDAQLALFNQLYLHVPLTPRISHRPRVSANIVEEYNTPGIYMIPGTIEQETREAVANEVALTVAEPLCDYNPASTPNQNQNIVFFEEIDLDLAVPSAVVSTNVRPPIQVIGQQEPLSSRMRRRLRNLLRK